MNPPYLLFKSTVGTFVVVSTENYPTLRSNEQVQSLIVELEGTENKF